MKSFLIALKRPRICQQSVEKFLNLLYDLRNSLHIITKVHTKYLVTLKVHSTLLLAFHFTAVKSNIKISLILCLHKYFFQYKFFCEPNFITSYKSRCEILLIRPAQPKNYWVIDIFVQCYRNLL